MRIRIEFQSRYTGTHCTFCDQWIHQAANGIPSWLSEQIGKAKFRRHKRTAQHKANRPSGEPAPALELDVKAFERRAAEAQAAYLRDGDR